MTAKNNNIQYKIQFLDGIQEQLDLSFSKKEWLLEPLPCEPCDFVALEFHQCSVCPLSSECNTHCPVAHNLLSILRLFQERVSHEEVECWVELSQRVVYKKCSLQEVLGSLIGLVMSTSGCPILDRFRPMSSTHLPFSNESETMIRALGMYALAQGLRAKENAPYDTMLESFNSIYEDIHVLNLAFADRFRSLEGQDANLNALVVLDMLAQLGSLNDIDEWMDKVKPLFKSFL